MTQLLVDIAKGKILIYALNLQKYFILFQVYTCIFGRQRWFFISEIVMLVPLLKKKTFLQIKIIQYSLKCQFNIRKNYRNNSLQILVVLISIFIYNYLLLIINITILD